MRHILRAGALLAAIILLGAALPRAAAASPPITRGQFCEQIVKALDVTPSPSAHQDFRDVSASSPYYSVVEAVYHAGWIAGVQPGVFDPNGDLTRAQAAKVEVLALGDGVAAQAAANQATPFTDDATIPSWARGYIAEASALHLISGFPDGSFQPSLPVTVQDAAALMRKLADAWAQGVYTVAVTTSTPLAAVGQQISLGAKVTDRSGATVLGASVTFTATSPDVVISGGSLIASAPGTYTVTGTYVNGSYSYTGTTQIAVAGPPAALRVDAPATVLANGKVQTQVTVDVLDAQGNVSIGDTGTTISLAVTGTAFAAPTSPLTAKTASGVATFTLTNGTLPGAIGTLLASDTEIPAQAQATVTSSAQSPASLKLTAPAALAVNKPETTAVVQAYLQDTTGQAVLQGTYLLMVRLSGPATFADGTTGPETFLYTGNGQSGTAAAYAPITIQDVQGQTGPVTLQVSTQGVPAQTVIIEAVIGGSAQDLTVTPPSGPVTRDALAEGVAFGLAFTDQNGLPTTTTSDVPLLISVSNMSGALTSTFNVDGQPQGPDGYLDATALVNGKFTVADSSPTSDVGSFIVQVSDPSGTLTAASPAGFTVVPGAAARVTAHLASTGLWVNAPTTTLTVQVVDACGNPVAAAGIPIQLSSASGNPYIVAVSPASGVTDANGQFIATVTAQPDLASLETVDVGAMINGKQVTAFPEPVFMVQPWGP